MTDTSSDKDRDTSVTRPGRIARRALFSVLASFFGVQSSANREWDAKQGSIGYYLLFGLVATAVLVGAIWLLVKFLIMQSGYST